MDNDKARSAAEEIAQIVVFWALPKFPQLSVDALADAYELIINKHSRVEGEAAPAPQKGLLVKLNNAMQDELCRGCSAIVERIIVSSLAAPAPQAATGKCTECGGDVFHRPGKPGEFDHSCVSQAEAPRPSAPNLSTDNNLAETLERLAPDLLQQFDDMPQSWDGAVKKLKSRVVAESRPSAEEVEKMWEKHIQYFLSEYQNPLIHSVLNVLWTMRPRM